ncbi:FAD-dependent thymidylate synthase [bacterium]|nr:FAD-dependent thymidylate synthase [bacterium]
MGNIFEKIESVRVPKLDEIIGKPFKVLDDGFVRVIDYMGTDASIVQAARVSYGKGTKQIRRDRDLIRYLLRHRHTSPFEMCEIKLHVRVPMDCWRQWIRHRTASVNEYSTRYSIAIDAKQKTPPDAWRKQATTNRQASEGLVNPDTGKKFTDGEKEIHDLAQKIYEERLEEGIAREQARKDLPLSTYTEAYWKMDLHNLLHFLELRMHPSAQIEIRSYANVIGNEIVKRWCPITWEAFLDYIFNSLYLSSTDLEIINHLIAGDTDKAMKIARDYKLITYKDNGIKRNIECLELEEKLRKLNIHIPWLGKK